MTAEGIWEAVVQEECQTNCDGSWQVGTQVPWDVAPKKKERVPHDLVSVENATKEQLPSRLISVLPSQEQRMYIAKADVNKFGPTDACPGCACIMVGRACRGSSQRSV